MSRPDEDEEDDAFSDDWNTGDFKCPPHLIVLCGLCGHDVCDDCGVHFIDAEEVYECPASTATL